LQSLTHGAEAAGKSSPASNKCASASLDSFDTFESPSAGNLLGQDAVKLGIDAVAIDRGRNELARRNPS
jgi:hypothetical protein